MRKVLPRTSKAHEVEQNILKGGLAGVMKAGGWMSGGTFTLTYPTPLWGEQQQNLDFTSRATGSPCSFVF